LKGKTRDESLNIKIIKVAVLALVYFAKTSPFRVGRRSAEGNKEKSTPSLVLIGDESRKDIIKRLY